MTRDLQAPIRLEDQIRRQRRQTPDRVALVDEDTTLTYDELERVTAWLAARLRQAGVGPETLVALHIPRSVEMVVGLLAILKAGGAYIPLDVGYPAERLASMLADSEARHVVTTRASSLPFPANVQALFVDALVAARDEMDIDSNGHPPFSVDFGVDDLIYVMYTSGSTGSPKGVMNTHRGVANTVRWAAEALSLTAEDVFLQKTSVSFDVSVLEILLPLTLGAKVILARRGGEADAEYIQTTIAEHGVTVVHFVPTMLRAFVAYADAERLASLRLVVSSGEALDPRLARDCLATIAAELVNLYGPTEAAIEASYWWCRRGDDAVPIGDPIANTTLTLVDEALRPVPDGVAGELCISGDGLARGYWRRPQETAQRFVTPPDGGPRFYRTGDRGRRRPDGAIELLGRLDRQVKVRGFRIELAEIERALTSMRAVHRAAAIVQNDGDHDARIVAFVAGPDPEQADVAALKARLALRLPEYMVPAHIVPLNEFPQLPNGKLDRRALAGAASSASTNDPREASDAPLVDIVRTVLAHDDLTPDDVLDDLGITSIERLNVVAKARRAGFDLNLDDLRGGHTLRALSHRRTMAEAQPAPVATPGAWPTHFPGGFRRGFTVEELEAVRRARNAAAASMPSPVQSVFLAMTESGRPDAATLTYEWHVDAEIDPDRLQTAWTTLIRRHDILRSAFYVIKNREPVRLIYDDIDTNIHPAVEDLARIDFELGRPPLVRLLVDAGVAPAKLQMRVHHALVDGWSIDVLFSELWSIYDGQTLETPPRYACYERWTAAAPLDDILDRETALLDGYETPDGIPTRPDKSPCKWDHGPKAESVLRFERQETEQIRTWAHQAQTTPFTVVFLGWSIALARFFERADLVHRVTQHGRSDQFTGIERMVGPTLHPALVRMRITAHDTVSRLLTRIDTAMKHVQTHHFPRDWAIRWFFNQQTNPWVSRFIDENFHAHFVDDDAATWNHRLGRRMRLHRLHYPDAEPLSTMLLYGPRLTLLTTYSSDYYRAEAIAGIVGEAHRASLEVAQTRRGRIGDLSLSLPCLL